MKTSQNGEINHEYKTTDGSMGCLEPSVQIAQITDSYLHNVVTPDFFFFTKFESSLQTVTYFKI